MYLKHAGNGQPRNSPLERGRGVFYVMHGTGCLFATGNVGGAGFGRDGGSGQGEVLNYDFRF